LPEYQNKTKVEISSHIVNCQQFTDKIRYVKFSFRKAKDMLKQYQWPVLWTKRIVIIVRNDIIAAMANARFR